MLNSLVGVLNVLCPFGSLISPFLTDARSVCSKGHVAVSSFRASVAARLEQVMYSTSIIMDCYVTNSLSKNRVRVEGRGLAALPLLIFDRLCEGNAHRIC